MPVVGHGDGARARLNDASLMRYALISDIHANLPALEAVLRDVARRHVDATYHLGDLVGYAPWPNEVVDALKAAGIPGVAGNYDSTVATDYKHCGCQYEDPRQEELSHRLVRLDSRTRLIRNEGVPRRLAVSDRSPPAGRARGRPDGDAGSWEPRVEHRLRARAPRRRLSGEDGCGAWARRRVTSSASDTRTCRGIGRWTACTTSTPVPSAARRTATGARATPCST